MSKEVVAAGVWFSRGPTSYTQDVFFAILIFRTCSWDESKNSEKVCKCNMECVYSINVLVPVCISPRVRSDPLCFGGRTSLKVWGFCKDRRLIRKSMCLFRGKSDVAVQCSRRW